MSEGKIVHASIYDPSGFNLFKPEPNARAECKTIFCSCESCPLLKKKQCQCLTLFGKNCPYGKIKWERGFTKRARNFHSWVRETKEKYKDVPWLSAPTKKMEFIGDYVYLPYAHIENCKIFESKSQFLPKEKWTVENVIFLMHFVPQALFGGSIPSYQEKEVPMFLTHLREQDPEMWTQLIERMPHLNKEANHVGRKAYLKTLNAPIEWTEPSNYPVTWRWDGETLRTSSMDAYYHSWGKIDLESMELIGKPKERAVVVVQSNDWVNESTEFLD